MTNNPGNLPVNLLPGAILPLTGTEVLYLDQAGNDVQASVSAFGHPLLTGNQTPVPGVAMQIDALLETEPAAWPLQNEAGIWSTNTYAYAAFSQTMTAATAAPQGSVGELVTLFAFANSDGATAPVTALLADAVARRSSSFVNGANIIARNHTGVNGAKLVGLEIDVQAVVGTTISSNSAGLYINIFTAASSSPAIQIAGIAGGSWQNGFVSNGVTGAHFTVQTGASASAYGVNLTQGTFTNSALTLGTGAGNGGINFGGAAFGVNPFMFGDSGGNLNIDAGSAGRIKFTGATQFAANGAVATTMTSVGPTGSHTTVQEWLTILDAAGTVRYIPCY